VNNKEIAASLLVDITVVLNRARFAGIDFKGRPLDNGVLRRTTSEPHTPARRNLEDNGVKNVFLCSLAYNRQFLGVHKFMAIEQFALFCGVDVGNAHLGNL